MRRKGFVVPQLLALALLLIFTVGFIIYINKAANPTIESDPGRSVKEILNTQYKSRPRPSPSPDEYLLNIEYGESQTPSWKTFTDNEAGFQLLIPEDMTLIRCCLIKADRGNNNVDIKIGYGVINVEEYKQSVASNSRLMDERVAKNKPEQYKTAPVDFINSNNVNDILLNYERTQAFSLCGETGSCPRVENVTYQDKNGYSSLNWYQTFIPPSNYEVLQNISSFYIDGVIYRFSYSWRTEAADASERKAIFERIVNSFKIIN